MRPSHQAIRPIEAQAAWQHAARWDKPTGDPVTADDVQDVKVLAFRQPELEASDLDMGQVKASSATLQPLAIPKSRPPLISAMF